MHVQVITRLFNCSHVKFIEIGYWQIILILLFYVSFEPSNYIQTELLFVFIKLIFHLILKVFYSYILIT